MFYKAMLKKENARKNGKKAFTLIELIIVIAIIGILVAILIPTMLGFMDDAKKSTALANARTAYSAAAAAVTFLQTTGTVSANDAQGKTAQLLNGTDALPAGYTIAWSPEKAEGAAPVTGVISVTYTDPADTKITATYPSTTP